MTSSNEVEWVTIAQFARPRGNRGEILARSLSDSPGRFENLKQVSVFCGEENLGEFPVEKTWWHDDRLVFKLLGVDSIPAAEALSGCEARVPFWERAPLGPGAFYQTDLVGCELIDKHSGGSLGRVTGWQEYGGPALMEIDGDWLVPFTPAICKLVDVAGRRIEVDLPAGLKELNQP